MTPTLPILVVGGGIGGISTALGLARKGLRSIVLEKAPALGEIGAGIQLGPNAFHCFDCSASAIRPAPWRSISTACA